MDARVEAWLESLGLPRHAAILRGLLAEVESDAGYRTLEVCCSIARGAADELSDVDLGLGIADDAWPRALDSVGPMLRRIDGVVGLLEHRIESWGDRPHRRFFVQYRNGVQVDLVAIPAGTRRGLPAGSMALYDPDGRLRERVESSVERASADDVGTWTFLGWAALADLEKYLRRGSTWEALERLGEARTQAWRLWAAAQGLRYPGFGLTTILDAEGVALPPRIAGTVATLDASDLRRAALALGEVIGETSEAAAGITGASLPRDMAEFVVARLDGAGDRQ